MSDTTAAVDVSDPVDEPAGEPAADRDGSRLWLVSAVTAVVLLASLAYGIVVAVRAAPASSAPDSAAPAAAPDPDWPVGDVRWLLASAPAGSAPAQSAGSADYTMSVAQAAATYGDAAAAENYLKSLGFQHGAATAWKVTTPRYDVQVSLIQFASAAGATAWTSDNHRSLGAGPEIESSAPIAGIPGGLWSLVTPAQGADHRIAHVMFQRGAVGVHMIFWMYPNVNADVINAVAADQYAKLPTP